jgi:hypothetical protein
MTPEDLRQRRRALFTALTALDCRYPGRELPLIPALRRGSRAGPGLAASSLVSLARASTSSSPATGATAASDRLSGRDRPLDN